MDVKFFTKSVRLSLRILIYQTYFSQLSGITKHTDANMTEVCPNFVNWKQEESGSGAKLDFFLVGFTKRKNKSHCEEQLDALLNKTLLIGVERFFVTEGQRRRFVGEDAITVKSDDTTSQSHPEISPLVSEGVGGCFFVSQMRNVALKLKMSPTQSRWASSDARLALSTISLTRNAKFLISLPTPFVSRTPALVPNALNLSK